MHASVPPSQRTGDVPIFCHAAPLDYSFKELRQCVEIETEEPRSGGGQRPGKTSTLTLLDGQEPGDAEQTLVPQASKLSAVQAVGIGGPKMTRCVLKKVCTTVKLNNNLLESIVGLPPALEVAMINPSMNLQWLDLSFNMLVTIEPDLLRFLNLKALYMHGNCITSLSCVERLRKLPKLISLTLNGNPIESKKGYRQYVIGSMANTTLRSLDHSTFTNEEIAGGVTWFKAYQIRLKEWKEQKKFAASIED